MNPTERVPFVDLSCQHIPLRAEILARWTEILDQNRFILGPELGAFEAEFASFSGVKFCAGVGNGLDALTLGLRALKIGRGDEVVIPAHTFVATALAIVQGGAKPVLCDVDERTANLCATALSGLETTNIRAIMPVHLYGQICRMDLLMKLAERHTWKVIEDNAQAQGAVLNERPAGAWGDLSATSFYPGKNIGALGDAGAVLTSDAELDREVRRLRNYGSEQRYHHENLGCNSRLDEVQAAVLRLKLKKLNEWNLARRESAEHYLAGLKDVAEIVLPFNDAGPGGHIYHLFVIRTKERADLQGSLGKRGIETAIHYPIPIHLQKAFADYGWRRGQFPVAERWTEQALSLPIYPGLTGAQRLRVINGVREYYGHKPLETA